MSFLRSINDAVYSAVGYKLVKRGSSERQALYALQVLAGEEIRARILKIAGLLRPQRAVDVEKIRVGSVADGGYVMLNDFSGIRHALSFGISDNDTWDVDIAERGITVEQFDHTIPIPAQRPGLNFHARKIVATAGPDGESIHSILQRIDVKDPVSALLKIDIEHDEWPVFDAATAADLNVFSQIVVEFHGFMLVADNAIYDRYLRVLTKLAQHFGVVHVHANNFGPMMMMGGVPFPDVLEVTFANRGRYTLEPTDETFPSELDSPNCKNASDYYLGQFVF